MNFLTEHGIDAYPDLESRVAEISAASEEAAAALKTADSSSLVCSQLLLPFLLPGRHPQNPVYILLDDAVLFQLLFHLRFCAPRSQRATTI